ncbi:MAG TPA: DMT family transporter [Candidatus Polarisedimenticolaceae bacterium]
MPAPSAAKPLLALLAVTVIWGWTFSWMKQSLNAAEAAWGPGRGLLAIAWFVALRFGLAAILMLAVPAARRGFDGPVLRGGGLLGALLLAGFVLQMAGLQGVTPAVSAFLTSLYVVFTAAWIALRATHRLRPALVGGVVLATFGAGFINGPPQLTFGTAEWLTVASAAVFAMHILATDAVTKAAAPLPITTVSFAATSLGAIGLTAAAVAAPGGPGVRDLVTLAIDPAFATPLLLSCGLATVVALSLMNLFQRDLDPVRAAVVYALEPVWAAMVSIHLGLGAMDRWLWVGGAALLAGNLVAELGAARDRASTSSAAGL